MISLSRGGLRTKLNRRWLASVVLLVIGMGYSIPISSLQDNAILISEGMQLLLIAIAPLGVAILVHGRIRSSLILLLIVTVGELAYSIVQLSELHFDVGTSSLFTVGNESRWWNSGALYGTFAASGNKAFANALVLVIAVLMPVSLAWRDRRVRLAAAITTGAAIAAVLMSFARASIVALAVVLVVVAASRLPARRMLGIALVLIGASALFPVVDLAQQLEARGLRDASAEARFVVWRTLASAASPRWLVGEGYGSVAVITEELGLGPLNPQGADATGTSAENLYLRRFIEGGVIGLAAFVTALLLLFREGVARSSSADEHMWRSAATALVAALAVQSLTSDTIAFEQSAAVFSLLLGIVGAGLARSPAGARREL